ncbi:glycosyltransferase family 2 protein [Thalassotalea atypica]|uniref:glycosyltransferase family 2 protein n=1 Tax=Thalassotalea atypica TaxID=2054316 RepID=UPI0025725FDC|nr:glycosyltransferase family 2 protein [Thalassotalea atypica]
MKDNSLSVVILTFNEELHIKRCLSSLLNVTNQIFVVDSFSTDKTLEICASLGVQVYQRPWKNYADQFQWGLDNCPIQTTWVMRMDADEYIEPDLIEELPRVLSQEQNVDGFYLRRKYHFLGKWIKKGAVYPLNLLRIWRHGHGNIENRWMDEHIVLKGDGTTQQLLGHVVDDNLNNTRWWIDKHNKYADREMIDILDRKYHLFEKDEQLKAENTHSQAKIKRIVKEHIYNRLPIFIRPVFYFFYRYILRLGFLDGRRGFAFHFFQGLWYRALVDLRVYEAEQKLKHCHSTSEKIATLENLTGLKLK